MADLIETEMEYQAPVVVQFAPVYTAAAVVVKQLTVQWTKGDIILDTDCTDSIRAARH